MDLPATESPEQTVRAVIRPIPIPSHFLPPMPNDSRSALFMLESTCMGLHVYVWIPPIYCFLFIILLSLSADLGIWLPWNVDEGEVGVGWVVRGFLVHNFFQRVSSGIQYHIPFCYVHSYTDW